MSNVFDYIKNYCKVHNFDNVSYKSSVLTLRDFSNPQTFAPGFAVFYKMQVVGEVQNIATIDKPFLTVSTPTDFWDFAQIAALHDDGVLQRAESDFLFVCDGQMNIDLQVGSNALFQQVFNAQMYYIYVSILPENERKNRPGTVYDIRVNQRLN